MKTQLLDRLVNDQDLKNYIENKIFAVNRINVLEIAHHGRNIDGGPYNSISFKIELPVAGESDKTDKCVAMVFYNKHMDKILDYTGTKDYTITIHHNSIHLTLFY